MVFPSRAELVKQNKDTNNALIDLLIITGNDDPDVDSFDNLDSWDIVSVAPKHIEI